jgi:hypothetical protein
MARKSSAAGAAGAGYEGQSWKTLWDGTRWQPSNLESCSDRLADEASMSLAP